MAEFGLFVGFNYPIPGREKQAARVFNEFSEFLGGQARAGVIEQAEPVFLQPHGGDLSGFLLVRGERPKLDEMVASTEFQRQVTRAQLIVGNLGVVNCMLGSEVQRQMTTFLGAAEELT